MNNIQISDDYKKILEERHEKLCKLITKHDNQFEDLEREIKKLQKDVKDLRQN